MKREALGKSLDRFLAEDMASMDVTTLAVIPRNARVVADLVSQGSGVVSGVSAATKLARSRGLKVEQRVADGSRIEPGRVILRISGNARRLLSLERTLVNLVMHLSGIATGTRRMVDAARKANPRFRIAATRKTLPGLRDLEKAAVVDGGGEPHRRDLSSAILLKGNHQAIVGYGKALKAASTYSRSHGVEFMVEVGSEEEAEAAVLAGARRILIDNQGPSRVKDIVRYLARKGMREGVSIEATGGITERNIPKYARSGADIASVGSLTHSARAIPMHLVVRAGTRK